MLKRIVAATAALGVVVFGLFSVGAAGAFAAEPSGGVTAQAVIGGTGVLDAQGNGVAAVRGMMDLHVTVDGGIVLVRDFNNNAVVHVTGNGQTVQWLGYTAYFGVTEATVVAPDAGVIVVGKDINLHVTGRGWAFLKGEGEFTANGHGPFPWTPAGTFGSVTP